MTIKEQIDQLIDTYKKDFYNKTGISLLAIAETDMKKLDAYEVIKYVCYYLGVEEENLFNRSAPAVRCKEFIYAILNKMGYSAESIGKFLGIDRTTVIHMRGTVAKKMEAKFYKTDLYRCIIYVYEQVDNSFIKEDWHKMQMKFDSVFSD
jgi:hypothetical protein